MCAHDFKQVNDVAVCMRCGLTMPKGGKPFFDKKIVGYKNRKKGWKH